MKAARNAILALLDRRGSAKTICPSEAARKLARDGDWRVRMAEVHRAAEALARESMVTITWQGQAREVSEGPYRIGKK